MNSSLKSAFLGLSLVFVLTGLLSAIEPEHPQKPEKAVIDKPADSKVHLEGEELTELVGRVENLKLDLHKSETERLVFRPADGQGYFILLECSLLERLEKITSQGELLVKVSGVITEYNGKNYLLLRHVAVQRTEPAK